MNTLRKGTYLHEVYSAGRVDPLHLKNKVFTRWCRSSLVCGKIDDYKVVGRTVNLIEVFTTTLPNPDIGYKIQQLQIYFWLLEPTIQKLGYRLGAGYVKVFDQTSRHRIDTRRIEKQDIGISRLVSRINKKRINVSELCKLK